MTSREIKREGFLWLDLIDPSIEDLEKIGTQFKLDSATIHDCLEPEHLPKYESTEETTFIILRAYDLVADRKSDTVQKITHKVAMFFSKDFLITIHRTEEPYITEVFDKIMNKAKDKVVSTHSVANQIMYSVAKTYETGLETIYKIFESFEQDVFNRSKKLSLVQSYLLKRRIDIMGRMMVLMKGPVQGLMTSAPASCRIDFKDTKEFLEKVHYQIDLVHDNLTSLLGLQISLASQTTNEASFRTNEVMRVLTVISIFFLPLNFIVGFYGMNFSEMPFLHTTWGYLSATAMMIIVVTANYFWLRRKNIIKSLF
jgi:magnesium transporter